MAASKGEILLEAILHQLFPHYIVQKQVAIKVRPKVTLFVDILIPSLKLAFEFDGRQHFQQIPFFHATKKDFEVSKQRDTLKSRALSDMGYTLIRIKYSENLDEESLKKRILECLRS